MGRIVDYFERHIAKRDNPAGHAVELRTITRNCWALILGAIGLAINIPPIVYFAAIAYVVSDFLGSSIKWLAPFGHAITIAITAVFFFSILYAAQVFYHGISSDTVLADFKANWPHHLAYAVVLGGIIGNLFTYPGNLSQLVDYMNRA